VSTVSVDVAVNLLWCTPGEVGGSEDYLARQLAGLGELDSDIALTMCCTTAFAGAHPDLADRFAVHTPGRLSGSRVARIVAEHTWLAQQTSGFDLVHHGGGTTPLVGPRPIMLTIHDLQYLALPQHFSRLRLHYLQAMMPRSVKRASVVATPTEFVRDTVIDAFGIDASRVVVVPHGVRSTPIDNGVRVGGAAAPGAEQIEAVRRRYVLGDGPYVVYPAITHPHKNHQLLLDVMSRHWTDHALRLVLVGGAGAVEGDVARTIAERGLTDRVIRPGRVPGGDRDALIAGATALVFPSTYEGFGAPLIEAMAFGTPVVCGDHPALREVAGSAAIVLPADADAWSAALDEVDRRRAELVAAGHERVTQYTLAASGVALVDAYHLSLS
jgi:alpha-1,3-rhamnosyl/mannosyltransferase